MQLTLLLLLLVISTAMLVTILAVGAAVLACRVLQGKTEGSPLHSPVSEQSGDTGTMVIPRTNSSSSQLPPGEVSRTTQAVQQHSNDAGELLIS